MELRHERVEDGFDVFLNDKRMDLRLTFELFEDMNSMMRLDIETELASAMREEVSEVLDRKLTDNEYIKIVYLIHEIRCIPVYPDGSTLP